MKKNSLIVFIAILCGTTISQAQSTERVAQFSNDRTNVWKTTIYPTTHQALAMHRHDFDRVLVALSDGLLKITNDKGTIHYLKLEKNKAYYLRKDPLYELHQDENMTHHPISVMVIELK